MFRSLYDWMMAKCAHPHAIWFLAAVAFVESSVFPIPPDAMLIPMVLAARERAWRYAAVCSVASVLGGGLGYVIGWALYDTVGQAIIAFYGYEDSFEEFAALYASQGAWIVFGAGLTPFPYKVITITSGVVTLDPAVFMGASLGARALRFFAVAAILWYFGPPVRAFIERRFGLVTTAFFIALIGGFVLVGWLA